MKNQWGKPQLLILARSKMHENILSTCKTEELPTGGPAEDHVYCTYFSDPDCYYCAGEETT